MQIIDLQIDEIKPYQNNPRNNEAAVAAVAASIKEFGFKVPLVVDKNNVIVAGHTRHKAALQLGFSTVPAIRADDLTEEQVAAFRLADNKTAELAEWDIDKLEEELAALSNIDMTAFGFDPLPSDISGEYDKKSTPETLKQRFIMPPFSILDARQGDWQKRKKAWKKIIDSGAGRKDGTLSDGWLGLAEKHHMNLTGTSIFDPVLTEILINWFSPRGGKIIDPFAGGCVRGIVSQFLQREYTGIDLRQEQIDANEQQFETLSEATDFFGEIMQPPLWLVGDSAHIDEIVEESGFDFLLTCPPYHDLEKYSDDPNDLSNMDYDEFKAVYFEIIQKTVAKLKENAFAAIVVGEIRDRKGYYRNFIGDTIQAFESAGMKYYNEIILITAAGTLPVRAGSQFEKTRKVGNTHQKALIFMQAKDDQSFKAMIEEFDRTRAVAAMKKSVLVFLKGNAKLAKSDIDKYDFEMF